MMGWKGIGKPRYTSTADQAQKAPRTIPTRKFTPRTKTYRRWTNSFWCFVFDVAFSWLFPDDDDDTKNWERMHAIPFRVMVHVKATQIRTYTTRSIWVKTDRMVYSIASEVPKVVLAKILVLLALDPKIPLSLRAVTSGPSNRGSSCSPTCNSGDEVLYCTNRNAYAPRETTWMKNPVMAPRITNFVLLFSAYSHCCCCFFFPSLLSSCCCSSNGSARGTALLICKRDMFRFWLLCYERIDRVFTVSVCFSSYRCFQRKGIGRMNESNLCSKLYFSSGGMNQVDMFHVMDCTRSLFNT